MCITVHKKIYTDLINFFKLLTISGFTLVLVYQVIFLQLTVVRLLSI